MIGRFKLMEADNGMNDTGRSEAEYTDPAGAFV